MCSTTSCTRCRFPLPTSIRLWSIPELKTMILSQWVKQDVLIHDPSDRNPKFVRVHSFVTVNWGNGSERFGAPEAAFHWGASVLEPEPYSQSILYVSIVLRVSPVFAFSRSKPQICPPCQVQGTDTGTITTYSWSFQGYATACSLALHQRKVMKRSVLVRM